MGSAVAIVAWKRLPTNLPLVEGLQRLGLDAVLLTPDEAACRLGPGDVALVRLDVSAGLDGIEPGLSAVAQLRRRCVRVLNTPSALLAAHDKWQTAQRLARAGIPHPWTIHSTRPADVRALAAPLVLKPRFGSWGQDVLRCRTAREVASSAGIVAERAWFRRHGVLIQELIPPRGHDLRLIVASGRVVGAAERHSAVGEWRTNCALGGHQTQLQPSEDACTLARRAARAIGADLVGVDLLPLPRGGDTVLEVNAAADFDSAESLPGHDVYRDTAVALGLLEPADAPPSRRRRMTDEHCPQRPSIRAMRTDTRSSHTPEPC